MELWANTYSDRKQSVKTQRMLAEAEIVEKTREYVAGVACKGTGECLKAEGGFFGIGAKPAPKPSDGELTSATACNAPGVDAKTDEIALAGPLELKSGHLSKKR